MTADNGEVRRLEPPVSVVPTVAPPPDVAGATAAAIGFESIDSELTRLASLAIAEHAGVFEQIHQQLTSALAVTGNVAQPDGERSNQRPRPEHKDGQRRSTPGRPNAFSADRGR
jgi:hypothetical protein